MSEKKRTYMEEELEAVIEREKETVRIIFQREKIKLDDPIEMEMLKESDPSIKKEIQLTEDELSLVIQPPLNYKTFTQLKKKDEKTRWQFALRLLKKVENHSLTRLHLLICPENIVLDESVSPYILYYGVKESLPPYENDKEKLLQELKAAIAVAADGKYKFIQYLKLHETLELSGTAAKIMAAGSTDELREIIGKNIEWLEKKEKEYVHVTKKQWKWTRITALALMVVFLPALIFTLYSLIFAQPKQAAFINSQEHFLNKEYSEVVTTLTDYKIEDMPKVVQYGLAQSYIINESLTEEQKQNVQNTITLQADPQYYTYWIHIGRGNAKEALDIARSLEDRDLIVFALLKYREMVKADDNLSGDEKQQRIEEIQSEIDEYEEERKAQEEEESLSESNGNGQTNNLEDEEGTEDNGTSQQQGTSEQNGAEQQNNASEQNTGQNGAEQQPGTSSQETEQNGEAQQSADQQTEQTGGTSKEQSSSQQQGDNP
ncbi:type VII secretion protein EssB [Bacillaceae bacterium Marseille-Q3522]|nr:type VII secretion protein EssB [Bacillaceae bacterium Marseille-Q3522]